MVHARWRCTTCKVDTKKQHCEHFTDTCFQMSYIFQSQSGPKVHNLTQRLRNTHKFLSNFYAYLFPGWSQIVLNTTEKIMPDDAKITTTWEFHVESQEQQGTKVNCQWISVWYIYIYTHIWYWCMMMYVFTRIDLQDLISQPVRWDGLPSRPAPASHGRT